MAVVTQNVYEEGLRDRARYRVMLDAYARGDEANSVAALLQWDFKQLTHALAQMDGPGDPRAPWDERRYGLAAMLLTDVALRVAGGPGRDHAYTYLSYAGQLLNDGVRVGTPGLRSLAERWYFTMARYLRDREDTTSAERLLATARGALGGSAVILYESGTLAESIATDFVLTRTGFDLHLDLTPTLQFRTGHLNDALAWLRKAVALDPGNELGRVHLGRVLALRSEDDEALQLLDEAARNAKDDATAYTAALFIGGVRERQQRLEQAAAAYRQAIARFPRGQDAYVGLSEALQRLGRSDQSREVLASYFMRDRRTILEPRLWYRFEPAAIGDERLDALRRDVRR